MCRTNSTQVSVCLYCMSVRLRVRAGESLLSIYNKREFSWKIKEILCHVPILFVIFICSVNVFVGFGSSAAVVLVLLLL